MKKHIEPKTLIGILCAIGAAVTAFVGEIDNQKRNKKIDDMENRIIKLEEERSK